MFGKKIVLLSSYIIGEEIRLFLEIITINAIGKINNLKIGLIYNNP